MHGGQLWLNVALERQDEQGARPAYIETIGGEIFQLEMHQEAAAPAWPARVVALGDKSSLVAARAGAASWALSGPQEGWGGGGAR